MERTMFDPESVGELMQGESPASMISVSELARALAAQRQRTTIICEVCGAEKEVWLRSTQIPRTCSNTCRQRLFRQRRRDTKE